MATKQQVNKRERNPNVVYAYTKTTNRRWLKRQVADGKYKSVSAFVDEAIEKARKQTKAA